jgi:hypothetical protein
LGLLSDLDLSQFKEALEIAHAATTAYHECFSVVKLLRGAKLSFLLQDGMVLYGRYGRESRMANVFNAVFNAVMLMLLVSTQLHTGKSHARRHG